MPTMKMTRTIRADRDSVFRVFSDFPNAAARLSGVTRLEVLTDGPIGVGTRFLETRVMFNKEHTEEMDVVAFEPGKSYTIRNDSCGCVYDFTFRFVDRDGHTDVEMDLRGRPVSLFAKLMSPLSSLMFSSMMKKCMNRDLDELQAAAESTDPGGPPDGQDRPVPAT